MATEVVEGNPPAREPIVEMVSSFLVAYLRVRAAMAGE
jgi:hypothetical protein